MGQRKQLFSGILVVTSMVVGACATPPADQRAVEEAGEAKVTVEPEKLASPADKAKTVDVEPKEQVISAPAEAPEAEPVKKSLPKALPPVTDKKAVSAPPPSIPDDPNTFLVSLLKKDQSHPYFGYGSETGFIVNGKPGEPIVLTRGEKYTFLVNTDQRHELYLTTVPGGQGAGTYTQGIDGKQFIFEGEFSFTPNATTPSVLYYQCRNHKYMGGKIYVVNKGETAKVDRKPDLDPRDVAKKPAFEVTPRQVQQKLAYGQLLTMSSAAAKRIRASSNQEAKDLLGNASTLLNDAKTNLDGGETMTAMAQVDEALRLVNAAAQLVPDQAAGVDYKAKYERLLTEVKGYRQSYEKNLKNVDKNKLAVNFDEDKYSRLMDEAQQLAAQNDYQAATKPMQAALAKITAAVSLMLDDTTVVYDLNFANPQEEYEYELARYDSFHELVPIAIEQRQPNQRQVDLMNQFVEKAERIVGEGRAIADKGDFSMAIQAVQAATDNVRRALMLIGVR